MNAVISNCHHHHHHGHYRSVKHTCWRCCGTGRICGHHHDWTYPLWTLSGSAGGTSCNSSLVGCCHCCCQRTCPDCGGLGYKWEQEWVPCPCCDKPDWPVKMPEVTWTTTTTTTVTSSTGQASDGFRHGLGVNKVKSVSE